MYKVVLRRRDDNRVYKTKIYQTQESYVRYGVKLILEYRDFYKIERYKRVNETWRRL